MRITATCIVERVLPAAMAGRVLPFARKADGILFGSDDHSAAQRRSLLAFAIRIFNAVIAFASQVLLARWMGEFEYGIFVIVWVWMLIIGSLTPVGFHTSVIRFLPQYERTGNLALLRGIVLTTRIFTLLIATTSAALGLGLVFFAPWLFENYLTLPLALGFICLPMIAFSDSLDGLSRAKSWMMLALMPAYMIRPVLILGFMFLALQLGYAPSATTAMVAAIGATYTATLIQFFAVHRRLSPHVPKGPAEIRMREWLAVSFPIFMVEGFFFLLNNVDVLMVGYLLDPHDVAVYFATVKTLALAHFVFFAVKAGVAQQYSHYLSAGDTSGLARFASASVVWTFWPTVAMSVVMVAVGHWFLSLFGEGFVEGYPLLFILSLGVIVRASAGPAESLLNMSGNQRICAAIYGTTLALNIAFNFLLIPTMGIAGAAWAMTIAICAEMVMLTTVVWTRLGIPMTILAPLLPGNRQSGGHA